MVSRNIYISYILAFSKTTWFWLGIWIVYYLRFTTYAGIGFIETVLIVTMTVAEIPTGAVADLIGKKNTLISAFMFEAVGAFVMATAQNFPMLAFSVFIMCIGGALYSGTIDALIFDSLKEIHKEKMYDRIISNINTIQLITPAICSVIGGFLYVLHPSFPFFANSIGYVIGMIAAFLLIEPKVEIEKFSFRVFLRQTHKGFEELCKSVQVRKTTTLLLSIGFIVVITSEMLNSFLGVEFGFKAEQLSILWSVIYIISAGASQLTSYIIKRLKGNDSLILLAVVFSGSLLVSPILGLVGGGISLAFRSSLEGIFGNIASVKINNNTESRYRATTISTFNMIKNIPYLLSAYIIGVIADTVSAKNTGFLLGAMLMCIIVLQFLPFQGKKERVNSF